MAGKPSESGQSSNTARVEPGAAGDRLERRRVLAALGAGVSAAVAGCAGPGQTQETTTGTTATGTTTTTGDTTTPQTTGTTTGTTTTGTQTVQVRSVSEYGDILVGPDGMSLYMFDRDTQGESASTCYDDCASAWPPLVEESPTAGEGVTAELTTFERDDGSMQVAANGWPLYYYTSDEQPGDTTGQGVGGVWWLLRPDGTVIRDQGTTTTTEQTTTQNARPSPFVLGGRD